MRVTVGRLDKGKTKKGSAGFRIGIHDPEIDDYRRWLIYGKGLNAGLNVDGTLFLGNKKAKEVVAPGKLAQGIDLVLRADPNKGGQTYKVQLMACLKKSDDPLVSVMMNEVPAKNLYGNLALVVNHHLKQNARNGGARFWFQNWRVSGDKVQAKEDHNFGPILWPMYTLSRGTLKMNVMMPPLGTKEEQTVRLQIKKGVEWKTLAEEKIEANSRTAIFQIEKWNDKQDIPYRLAYTSVFKDGSQKESYYQGTVRKDPVDKKSLVVAGFTGNADYAFPNLQIVGNLKHQNPDMLFFSGDNIYEYVGGYGIIRFPADRAILNYLRKWWLFGLAFGGLTKDRPTVAIPDDHDVYQGNIWGNGGNKVELRNHEAGGYVQPAEMVNVVHRTQTGNLPDPYDPTPIKQNISVYYTDIVYGRVGFAVIADRMFKSGPRQVATWKGRPDHLKIPDYDLSKLDKPVLELLGKRQEKFLRHWVTDWKGVDMKCVLSQTNFCNVANYHGANRMYLVADLDSGGWPQSARNRAVDILRRGFALHFNGDQHLATIVHYGIEEPGDGNVSFCVPSIANFYPRRWIPDEEGKKAKNRPKGGLPNTGDYRDGLGHPIRVLAVANPEEKYRPGRLPSLHDKASGYGIVRFNHDKQTITLECYKLLVDVSGDKKGDQFPGWPQTISMLDNYGRKASGYLPTITVKGMADPVVQIIDEGKEEIVYTLRIKGQQFRPKVFAAGKYTVKVGELDTDRVRVIRGVEPTKERSAVLKVTFE